MNLSNFEKIQNEIIQSIDNNLDKNFFDNYTNDICIIIENGDFIIIARTRNKKIHVLRDRISLKLFLYTYPDFINPIKDILEKNILK